MLLRSSASQLPCSVPLTYDIWPQQLDLSWSHLWLEQLSVDADSPALRQALAWAWPQGSLAGQEGFPRLPSWRGLIFSQARSSCSAKYTIKQNSFSEGEKECVFVLKQIYFQFKQQTLVTINGIFQNIYRHKRELFPKAVSYSARCCHRLVTHTVTPTFTPTCRICAASHSVWHNTWGQQPREVFWVWCPWQAHLDVGWPWAYFGFLVWLLVGGCSSDGKVVEKMKCLELWPLNNFGSYILWMTT